MSAGRWLGCGLICLLTAWVAWPGFSGTAAPGFVPPSVHAGAEAEPYLRSALVNAATPPRVHAASIAALPDGRLFSVWFGGEREGSTDVKIFAAYRETGALAWGEQHAIASPEQTTADTGMLVRKMGNPVAFVTPRGELWVIYVSVTMGGWATSHINLMRSPDLGRSWLPATRLVTSPFINLSTLVKGGPVFFDNGEIGVPVYHELAGKFAELLVLSDTGEMQRKIRMDHGHRTLQPVVLVEDAQRAIALMRDGAEHPPRAWRSETTDGGRSWSAPQLTDLPNPNSALAALRLDDGRLIAVANDTEDERLRLSLLVSEDRGAHWRAIHRFEDRQDFLGQDLALDQFRPLLAGDLAALGPGPTPAEVEANAEQALCRHGDTCNWQYDYPYLIRTDAGEFHLVYTWNRSFVRHLSFNRAWLESKL
ncbi:hypothetical protein CEW83_11575 [Parazoarcus communis]|uniref:Sialidase domain-containing protein n=1 Tax=Parazoarcus communis TaxID=41977 RepID=A0A2U8GRF8_9RHOO|nr:sialidase family protein [Parazoarcus communis]AWI75773.1 hypothetical protein CEW83_11575 [Parazoarcus communis]